MPAPTLAAEFGAAEFNQITVSNSAVTLESLWVAAGGTAFDTIYAAQKRLHAIIHPEANVRYDPEGGTPTASVGLRWLSDNDYIYENQYRILKTTKVIREGASDVKVNVAIFV